MFSSLTSREVEGRTWECLPNSGAKPLRTAGPPRQAPQGSYQGHVIQDEPKGCCSLCKVVAHLPGDQLSLGDQFSCIKASLPPGEGRAASQDNEQAKREPGNYWPHPSPLTAELSMPPRELSAAAL